MKKILSAMTESLVVVICTIAFALTAVGILASVLERGPAGNRDFVDYWVSAPANPHDAHLILPLEQPHLRYAVAQYRGSSWTRQCRH